VGPRNHALDDGPVSSGGRDNFGDNSAPLEMYCNSKSAVNTFAFYAKKSPEKTNCATRVCKQIALTLQSQAVVMRQSSKYGTV